MKYLLIIAGFLIGQFYGLYQKEVNTNKQIKDQIQQCEVLNAHCKLVVVPDKGDTK